MWIDYICGLVFFVCVPGIVFTVPTENKYLTAGVHAVIFVIVHHLLNAVLKKEFGIEEPSLTKKQK